MERFLSVVERYTEIPELTPCILHEFVEKIVVHTVSDPKGKNRTQEIDIYCEGIGAETFEPRHVKNYALFYYTLERISSIFLSV